MRFFTRRECCRMQGFPDTFLTTACTNANRFYHMLGNSVSPPVITDIAREMIRAGFLQMVKE